MESIGDAKPQEVPVTQKQEEEFTELAMETVEKGPAEAMADGEGVKMAKANLQMCVCVCIYQKCFSFI